MHLDVKPSNIMLQPGGEVVLIDFGVSKRYDDGGGQTSSTPVGISKGYAPLEQYVKDGISTVSPATDIYSLGGHALLSPDGRTTSRGRNNKRRRLTAASSVRVPPCAPRRGSCHATAQERPSTVRHGIRGHAG